MELTDWFGGDVPPAHVGVYERDFGRGWYSLWNGSLWGWTYASPDGAALAEFRRSHWQSIPWRGLAKEPK